MARRLIQAASLVGPVIKKGYVGLMKDLASDLQAVCRRDEATTGRLAERKAKLSDLHLKVQPLAEKAGLAVDL